MRYILLVISTLIVACNNPGKDETVTQLNTKDSLPGTPRIKGVLIVYSDSLEEKKEQCIIYNPDNTQFTSIALSDDGEPSSAKLNGNILAYYPDYYIIHFNADKTGDSIYSVEIGKELKTIKRKRFVEYLEWPDYILKFYCLTDDTNPLRQQPSDSAKIITGLDYKDLNFKCRKISGDWVYVVCDAECEGCPANNTNPGGWIRWRKNGKVILNQRYIC